MLFSGNEQQNTALPNNATKRHRKMDRSIPIHTPEYRKYNHQSMARKRKTVKLKVHIQKALTGRWGLYHTSQVFSGKGLRDRVLNNFQSGGQKISLEPPAIAGTKKYSSQISFVISFIPTLRPISFRLIKNGSRANWIL